MSILELHPDKIRVDACGCWIWTAGTTDGYGRVRHLGRKWLAHRLAFMLAEGYTPPRPLVMDHLCRNRACCNPDHLAVVTIEENIRRGEAGKHNAAKTLCAEGHSYSGDNLYVSPNGERVCRACNRERTRRYRERQRAA